MRAEVTSFVRETRAKMGDLKGKVPPAIVRLRVLAYEKHAASPVALLAALWYRRQVTRASKPATVHNNHRAPKPPSFATRLRNHIPFDARLVSRWLGLFR